MSIEVMVLSVSQLSVCVVSCSDCSCPLKSWYCQRDGMLLCKEHYRTRFDEACNNCAVSISGPVMVSPVVCLL